MVTRFYRALVFSGLALLMCGCGDDDDVTGDDSQSSGQPGINVPAEQPTIQAAIDAARPSDTIWVADGTYSGLGNRDIVFNGKWVVLKSENGPDKTIIDCRAEESDQHFGFSFSSTDETKTVIDGFTIRNGFSAQGSALLVKSASPTIKNCVFYNNVGTVSAGAVRCKAASPRFENCTFVANSAPVGATVLLIATAKPEFENCIVTQSTGGEAITCSDTYSTATFRCSNVYGNEGGDWIGCLSGQENINGNICADPLFCEVAAQNFRLQTDSPCASQHNSCGEVIGALDADCGF